MYTKFRRAVARVALVALGLGCEPRPQPIGVVEATIAQIHDALGSGRTTCRMIVQAHLDRIAAYEEAVNAITVVNPTALARADEIDRALEAGEELGPLYCVPTLVKAITYLTHKDNGLYLR